MKFGNERDLLHFRTSRTGGTFGTCGTNGTYGTITFLYIKIVRKWNLNEWNEMKKTKNTWTLFEISISGIKIGRLEIYNHVTLGKEAS